MKTLPTVTPLIWVHLVLMVLAAYLIIFIVPIYLSFILLLLHRVHLYLFGDCLITRVQHKTGSLPKNLTFYQYMAKRFFRVNLTLTQTWIIDYSLISIYFLGAYLRTRTIF